MNKTKPLVVEELVSVFDFEAVRAFMYLRNWTWDSAGGVPTIEELRTSARSLLERAAKEHRDYATTWRSGGFSATVAFPDEDGSRELSLEFVLAEASGTI